MKTRMLCLLALGVLVLGATAATADTCASEQGANACVDDDPSDGTVSYRLWTDDGSVSSSGEAGVSVG